MGNPRKGLFDFRSLSQAEELTHLPYVPQAPPVPVVIPPRQQGALVEYHKGARYRVSIMGGGLVLFLAFLVVVISLAYQLPIWLSLLVVVVIAALLFLFVPRVKR